jgi:hypothetical protein
MNYTHALNLMSGESITITEKQAVAIREALIKGAEWIPVGNELINAKSISKVGYHHDTANAKKRQEATAEQQLVIEGKGCLVDERRRLATKLAVKNAIAENRNYVDILESKAVASSEKHEEKGEPMYYLDELGEKMYS